jgi:hypothetical protein
MESNAIYESPKANLIDNTSAGAAELDKVLQVAKRQKALVYTFLAYFFVAALQGLPQEIKVIASILIFPIWIAIIILNARLCLKVYGKFAAVLLIVLGIIPLINFLVVLAASSRANKLIKSAGFKVGFMGANTKEIDRALQQKLSAATNI